jgi:hypothetical protein
MPDPSLPAEAGLPPELVQALAAVNESVLRHTPAVLSTIEHANRVFAQGLQQQAAIAQQQALNVVTLALAARCAHALLSDPPGAPSVRAALEEFSALLRQLQPAVPASPTANP